MSSIVEHSHVISINYISLLRETDRGLLLKIAIVGTRGLPPQYGGYETFSEYFVRYFIENGHEVTVACERTREEPAMDNYKGANLVYFPFQPPERYSLRKIYEGLNDLYFYFKLARKTEIMYILAGLGTQVLPLLRIINPRLRIVTNNDGLEWKRSKYNKIERILWKSFIRSSMRSSHLVVHDNPRLADFFPRINMKNTISIPYGVEKQEDRNWDKELLIKNINHFPPINSLAPENYYIIIARLQSDNNTHVALEGFLKSESDKKLLVIGDPQDSRYLDYLQEIIPDSHKDRILLIGSVYNQSLLGMLRSNSFAYIHGHSAGGTNPSLLEAMSDNLAIIAHDNPFNRNVLDNNGFFFDTPDQVCSAIKSLEHDSEIRKNLASSNGTRARQKYTWKKCMSKHEKAFMALLNSNSNKNI